MLTVRLNLPEYRYAQIGAVRGFWDELRSRVEALPEVTRAGAVYDLPIEANWMQSFTIAGDADPMEGPRSALYRTVTPGATDETGEGPVLFECR